MEEVPKTCLEMEKVAGFDFLSESFVQRFHAEPEFFIRAPGRINLIGEHIDYEGYGVLPMALSDHAVQVAVARKSVPDGLIHLGNTDARFEGSDVPVSFPADPLALPKIDVGRSSWLNYVKSAYKTIWMAVALREADPEEYVRHFSLPLNFNLPKNCEKRIPVSAFVLVSGNVPVGAGVSSSAALMISTLLSFVSVNGLNFSRQEVASIAVVAESETGGGMDQSVSCLARANFAQFIEFNPIRSTLVALPQDMVVVVANSCEVSEKHVTRDLYYNKRVIECRLGALILGRNLMLPQWESIKTLRDFEEMASNALKRGECGYQKRLLSYVRRVLHPLPYDIAELDFILGPQFTVREIVGNSLGFEAQMEFELRNRALHVLQEKERVLEFIDLCSSSTNPLPELGRILNSGHESCRDLYECSTSRLDRLVSLGLTFGALGGRLTGAGWGGCALFLLSSDMDVSAFQKKLEVEFFEKEGLICNGLPPFSEVCFSARPGPGASVIQVVAKT